MMLSDKIRRLRKENNMSVEDLSEIVDVSKLSINKWESGESTPTVEQILILSEAFGVTTDHLLKNNDKDPVIITKENLKDVTLEEATSYLEKKSKASKLVSIGVLLCIIAVVPLLLLNGFSDEGIIDLTSNQVTSVGMIFLFTLVAIAVGIFIRTNHYTISTSKFENNKYHIEDNLMRSFEEELDTFRPLYFRRVTFAVAMIIMSVVPLITVAILSDSSFLALLMVVLLLFMVGLGIYVLIPASTYYNAIMFITELNEDRTQQKKEEERTGRLAAFYWPLVTAIYLGWSLWTMDWGRTWVVWPVAGIAFVALVGLIGVLDKNN